MKVMIDDSKEIVSSKHNMIHAHMSSLSPKWNVFTKVLPSRLSDIGGKGSRNIVGTRCDGLL